MTHWHDIIHFDPNILGGKPVVRGTRLSVDFLLGLLDAGWSEEQVLDNYPSLVPDSLRAIFDYAAESLREEAYLTPTSAAH